MKNLYMYIYCIGYIQMRFGSSREQRTNLNNIEIEEREKKERIGEEDIVLKVVRERLNNLFGEAVV